MYEINPIFLIPNVIDGLARNATHQDLYKLRQMSKTHYKSLNYTFLDRLDKRINFYSCSAFGNRQIEDNNWDSDFAYIFRTILIFTFNSNKLIPLHVKIMSQISSHITTLKLKSLVPEPSPVVFDSEFSKSEMISKLIGIFPNLKQIKLHYYTYPRECSLDELELALRNINPNIKVRLIFNRQFKEIMDMFGTKPNYSFKIKILHSRTGLDTFQEISNRYGHLLNWEIDLTLNEDHVDTTQKLDTLVMLSLRHQQQIKKFYFILDLNTADNGYLDRLRSCLTQISPILTRLWLGPKSRSLDLLGGILSWPRLDCLRIIGYSHHLGFLKYCPALTKLDLSLDIPLCFSLSYSSPLSDSDKEQLKDCFGNLGLLKHLSFCGTRLSESGRETYEFAGEGLSMECKSYLMELLPACSSVDCTI